MRLLRIYGLLFRTYIMDISGWLLIDIICTIVQWRISALFSKGVNAGILWKRMLRLMMALESLLSESQTSNLTLAQNELPAFTSHFLYTLLFIEQIFTWESSINIFLGFRGFLPNTWNYRWALKLWQNDRRLCQIVCINELGIYFVFMPIETLTEQNQLWR